jgi:outer membrane protein OmpA-like peptidoglycan-associated protein
MRSVYLVVLLLLSLFDTSFAKPDATNFHRKTIAPFVRKKNGPLFELSPSAPMAPMVGRSRLSRSERNYVGLEAGSTISMQFGGRNYAVAGNYVDGIRNAELDSYSPGVSLMAHAVLDVAIDKDLGIQAKAGYRHHQARATGISPEGNVSGTEPELANDVTFKWDFASLDALLRVQLAADGWYVLGGLGYSSLLSNYMAGTQTFDNGSGSDQQFTFEGELRDFYNSSRIDAKIGIGTWLPLNQGGLVIAPELMIAIPLTSLHSETTSETYRAIDRKVNNMLYASLGFAIKFPFGGNSTDDQIASSSSSSTASSTGDIQPRSSQAILSGKVINDRGELINDAEVTVVDLYNNEIVATDETENGVYSVKVTAPGRYSVTADAPGYLFGSTLFEVDGNRRILKGLGEIKLSPSADGRVRLLVFFDFDKATLQSSSYPELDRAVALMKANPNMEVEIAGFTDAQGSDSYNKDLSQRRANTVREYIVRKGIDAARLIAAGYGETNPVASNDVEEGRAENRRVEFVVKRR